MDAERSAPVPIATHEAAAPQGGTDGAARGAPAEARRQLTVCNACRYCEGLCPVFPAMERRTVFAGADLAYLANLCHDCRGCWHACPYTPPHAFAIDLPRALAEMRVETYRRAAWPGPLGALFERNGWAVGTITGIATLVVVALVLALQDPAVLTSAHTGEGAFYRVVPYRLMVWPAAVTAVWALVAMAAGGMRFWSETGAGPLTVRALGRPVVDALRLTYLGRHAPGCDAPGARLSDARRRLHHLVFYGFALTFASTCAAAFHHHVLSREAPYPLVSVPVLLGTAGGIALVVGTTGLLALRGLPAGTGSPAATRGMDVAFLVLLDLTGVTGLALLALRETAAMGLLLAVHLGVVAGLFLALPYTKVVHGLYRYLALVRDRIEESG